MPINMLENMSKRDSISIDSNKSSKADTGNYRSFDEIQKRSTTSSTISMGNPQGNDTNDHDNNKRDGILSLSDGYTSWSGSLSAFHHGFFHLVLYIILGILGYAFVLETQWNIIDSIYFSTVIFTTVGYGDISPDSTTAGMIFTMVYCLYGIIIIGIFLGICGDFAIERHEAKRNESETRTRREYLDEIMQADHEFRTKLQQQQTNLLQKEQIMEEEALLDAIEEKAFCNDVVHLIKEQLRNVIILIVIGIPIIILERWSVVKGLYWMIITATTIGLGDETPEHDYSKLICIFYIPMLVAFCGSLVGRIAQAYVDKRNDRLEGLFLNRVVTRTDLDKMDIDNSGKVERDEFLVYMLLTLQKVDETDITELLQLFRKLDKDSSGTISIDDLHAISNSSIRMHKRRSTIRY